MSASAIASGGNFGPFPYTILKDLTTGLPRTMAKQPFDGLSEHMIAWLSSNPIITFLSQNEPSKGGLPTMDSRRHLIKQPNPQSSIASCVAMLLLDNEITPDYEKICSTEAGTVETACTLLMDKRGSRKGTVRDIITSTVVTQADRGRWMLRLGTHGSAIVVLEVTPENSDPYTDTFILDSLYSDRDGRKAGIRRPQTGRAYEVGAGFLLMQSPTIRTIQFIQIHSSQFEGTIARGRPLSRKLQSSRGVALRPPSLPPRPKTPGLQLTPNENAPGLQLTTSEDSSRTVSLLDQLLQSVVQPLQTSAEPVWAKPAPHSDPT